MQSVPITTKVVSSNPPQARCIRSIEATLCDKFVSDLRQVGGFFQGTPVSSTNKTVRHNITEILLKLELSTISLTPYNYVCNWYAVGYSICFIIVFLVKEIINQTINY